MICDMMVGKLDARRAIACTLVGFALLASGCVQQPKPERDDVAMATSPEQVRRAPTQPALPQAAPEPEKPAAKPVNAAKTPEPVEPVAPVDTTVYSANELVGKSQTEVTALIGSPARVEQRAASTVWTYRKDECGLDVFFFLDMATSDERVLTVESTADSTVATDAAATIPAADAGAAAAGAAAPAAEAQASPAPATASDAANAQVASADGGSVVDSCYGKLRRS
jgi:hypothetical protein